MRKLFAVLVVGAMFGSLAQAQSVLSAKAGTIHHVDGKAWISGKALKPLKTGDFPSLEAGQTLSTEDARAEVLLTPGVFLRLGADSEIELVKASLIDAQVRLLKGSALIEAGEVAKDTSLIIEAGNYRTSIAKYGLYRFDAEPARVRVFEGQLQVSLAGDGADARPITLKKGRELTGTALSATKFDAKTQDELFAWSNRRSAIVAQANFTAARTAYNSSNGRPRGMGFGSWVFLPTYGFFTYLPGNGRYMSPFGYYYFSPLSYYTTFVAPPVFSNSGPSYSAANAGWSGAAGYGNSGYSGGGSSSAASAVASSGAPAMAAPSGAGATGGGAATGGARGD